MENMEYDLAGGGDESLEVEEGEEAPLECSHAGKTGGGRSLSLTLATRIDYQSFSDASEFCQQAIDAERLAFPRQFALEQAGEQQGQHAVEGVHLDFRVGPVKHRAPSQEVRILHLLEGIFNVVLRTVGQHNLLLGPVGVVGKQDGFAKLDATEPTALR